MHDRLQNIAAIVLAAGASRRMGTQKLLLPYGGSTVIRHIFEQVTSSKRLAQTIAVTQPGADRIVAEIADFSPVIATNPDPDADMLSSVRCGLRHVTPACEAVMVLLGDQPSITSALLRRLIDAHEPGGMTVPTFEGRRGHPLLFSKRWVDDVMHRFDGDGLRGLLDAHPECVRELPVLAPDVTQDMDTPADYARLTSGHPI